MELWPVLPVPNYVLTIAIVCLNYLRGNVREKYSVDQGDSNTNPGHSAATLQNMFESNVVESDYYCTGRTDNVVWQLVGLGFRSFKM